MIDLNLAAQYWGSQLKDDWHYDKGWYHWTGTHWQYEPIGDSQALDATAISIIEACGGKVTSQGPIDTLMRLAKIYCKDPIIPTPNLINFKNGALDITTMNLQTHARSHNLTYCLPYDYDPSIGCPNVTAYLGETIPDDKAILCVKAHFGLALMRDIRMQKAMLLPGVRRSGKSSIGSIGLGICGAEGEGLRSFAGDSLFIDNLEGKRERANRRNSLLVVVDELPPKALGGISGENFKRMASHGGVGMRSMYQEDIADNIWTPKILMTMDGDLYFSDKSGAVAERLVVGYCPNRRSEDQQDPYLIDKMMPEWPTFVHECIEAAKQVLAQGRYQQSEIMIDQRAEIESQGNLLKAFVRQETKIESGAYVEFSKFYDRYTTFCGVDKDGKSRAQPSNRITRDLIAWQSNIEAKNKRIKGQNDKVRCLVGIHLMTEKEVSEWRAMSSKPGNIWVDDEDDPPSPPPSPVSSGNGNGNGKTHEDLKDTVPMYEDEIPAGYE